MECDDSVCAEISHKTFNVLCYKSMQSVASKDAPICIACVCVEKRIQWVRLVLSTQLNCPVSVWMVHFCLVCFEKIGGFKWILYHVIGKRMPREKKWINKRICVIIGVNFHGPMVSGHEMVVQKKNKFTVIQINRTNMCDGGWVFSCCCSFV